MLAELSGAFSGQLLNVGMVEYNVQWEIWIYTKGLWPPKDFGLWCMDFSILSSKKRSIMVNLKAMT